jgi:hypothetical protein
VVAADFDNDGFIDIATANENDNNISILPGNGDGTFADSVNFPAGYYPAAVTYADFDADGDIDLAAADYDSGKVAILDNLTIALGIEGEDVAIIPDEIIISNCYPNPFNAVTTIEYTLGEGYPISIDIYDLLGRKISTIYNGYNAPGTYRVQWYAINQSSGIYFYRISAGSHDDIGKMYLLK